MINLVISNAHPSVWLTFSVFWSGFMVRGTSCARLLLGSTDRERVQIELVRSTTALSVAWPFEGGHLVTDGGDWSRMRGTCGQVTVESRRPLALTGGHNGQLFLTEFERPQRNLPPMAEPIRLPSPGARSIWSPIEGGSPRSGLGHGFACEPGTRVQADKWAGSRSVPRLGLVREIDGGTAAS
jgi:hypothetical protein